MQYLVNEYKRTQDENGKTFTITDETSFFQHEEIARKYFEIACNVCENRSKEKSCSPLTRIHLVSLTREGGKGDAFAVELLDNKRYFY